MEQNRSGMVFSQSGAPVRFAADYQKVMDTRWRYMDVEIETEVTINRAESGSTHWWYTELFRHNLGYLPAFTYRQMSVDLGGLSPGSFRPEFIATKNAVYLRNLFVSTDPTTPLVIRGYIRVFCVDITKEFKSPIEFIVPSTDTPYPKVGVKMLSKGSNIYSDDLSDFSINTQGKAFAVQQTGKATASAGNGNKLNIIHGLGYPPTYFIAKYETAADFANRTIFANPLPASDEDWIFPMNVATGAKVSANAATIEILGGQSALVGTWAYLITKEPAEVAI